MTVSEIAKLAGVSIGTVDRVIHKRGRVSSETREKIEAILESAGYRPNPLARHLKRARPYRIGVLMPALEDESCYWRQVYEGLLSAKEELAAFSFDIDLFEFSRDNDDTIQQSFSRMKDAQCDARIVAPVRQTLMRELLSTDTSDSPLICIDSPLPGASPNLTIAQDPWQGGLLAARLMRLVASCDGPFATVRPYTGAFNLDERVRGFREAGAVGQKEPNTTDGLDTVCSSLEDSSIEALVEGLFERERNLKGVFVVSSIGHLIAKQVQLRGRLPDVRVIAWDLVDENVRALESGELSCVIAQRPFEQGRLALHQLYRILVLGETIAPRINIPLDIHFKENLPS